MKKLMLSAAIVCAAVMAHAAVVNWAGDINYEDSDGESAAGYVEFFLNGDSLGSVDIDSALCSFEFEGITVPGMLSAVATITNFGEAGDQIGTKNWSYAVTQDWLDEQPAGTEGGTLGGKVASGLGIGDARLVDGAAANGYTAVPEPTSGLLLLLGVAGLALRRRRA